MKNIISFISVLFAVIFFGSSSLAAEANASNLVRLELTGNGLAIRSEPQTNSLIFGKTDKADKATFYLAEDATVRDAAGLEWYKVVYVGKTDTAGKRDYFTPEKAYRPVVDVSVAIDGVYLNAKFARAVPLDDSDQEYLANEDKSPEKDDSPSVSKTPEGRLNGLANRQKQKSSSVAAEEPGSGSVKLTDSERGNSVDLAPSETAGYLRYANESFGYSVDIPATFNKVILLPDLEDGLIVATQDEQTQFRASGGRFVEGAESTLKQSYGEAQSSLPVKAAYATLKNDFWALSWLDGEVIHYRKYLQRGDAWCDFELSYPAAQKQTFDSMVKHIADSLTLSPE
jgi:hypothetical protein